MSRSSRRRLVAPLVAAALSLATLACAAPAGAQVRFDTAHVRVEVLGLKRWTLAMLRDSVRVKSGGEGLESSACQIVLRDSLHFADALVMGMYGYAPPFPGADHWLVLKVVEPDDAAAVRWTAFPRDSFRLVRPAYTTLVASVTDTAGDFHVGRILWPLQFVGRPAAERKDALARARARDREDARRLDVFLATHRTPSDWRTARDVLRGDPLYANRLAATVVLANYSARDSTWWLLTEALRDPNEMVRSAAMTVLAGFPSRSVNWTPVAPTLRTLLGGTNVAATQNVMELLARTHASPSLAAPLLRDNGAWVLTHLRAESPGARPAAHALLVQLAGGRDLGESAEAWDGWMEGLR